MEIAVLKFGGTSLRDLERIKKVSQIVLQKKNEGFRVVVVVSAMGDTTDQLLELAYKLSSHPQKRELDLILSTGEQVSASLLAIYLNSVGEKAISLNAYQIPIFTDGNYNQAKIVEIAEDKIRQHLEAGFIVVIPGFQGIACGSSEVNTLGRGGSDTTAVALAYSLGVKYCEIYTDVDGIFTANPEIEPEAKKLDTISYEEMIEFAGNGAEVLHPRSVVLAQENNIVIHVRNSYSLHPGTFVREKESYEKSVVAGVTYTQNEGRITLEKVDFHKIKLSDILELLKKEEININLLAVNKKTQTLSFTVSKKDFIIAVPLIGELSEKGLVGSSVFDTQLARISIIGSGMRDHPGVAYKMVDSLMEAGVPIQMVSSSDIKVSCFINKKYLVQGVRAIHKKFNLKDGPYFGEKEGSNEKI